MICPRCGFPTHLAPCQLCGQTDFDQFELTRFTENSGGRMECTIIVPSSSLSELSYSHYDKLPHATSDEMQARLFVFFADCHSQSLFDFLSFCRTLQKWSILVNGRVRPFVQELWLPLLELSELS
jgi:hypothetical protein